MRVLVCGSRDYSDGRHLAYCLSHLYLEYKALGGTEFVVIEGEAAGADRLAAHWAESMAYTGVKLERYWANWQLYNRRAGYLRNLQMLEEGKPDLVMAFFTAPNLSKGTKMMVDLARGAGVEVWANQEVP